MADIDRIASSLRRAKEDRGAVVLLGAGVSQSAGIPLAGQLMKDIEQEFGPLPPNTRTYAEYMNFVAPGERRKLLSHHIDNARINWAHIALASLIAGDYVKCILTTNFDPLIVRSCAMLGRFPAVYDVPSTKFFDPAEVVDPSIFYLHGQRTGFVMLNTADEFRQNTLDAVFRRAGERRPWIVIGYSGNSDPVFDQLASYKRFDYRLFWIGFRDEPPSEHVREQLLKGDKYADYVNGYDADSFFVALAKKLGCFPPDLFAEPLKHLRQVIAGVNPFNLPGHGKDLRELADRQTERARHLLEAENGQRAAMANSLVVANKYDQLLTEFKDEADASPEIAEAVAWGWLLKGLASMDAAEAEGIEPEAADKLLLDAIRCNEEALNLHPQFADAHFNWGYTLGARSKLKSGDEAKKLFDDARAHYASARELDPNDYETPYNLGNLLGDRADVVEDDEEAIALLREAVGEYEIALKLKPKDVDVLTNLAATLKTLAAKVDDPEPILRQANEAYTALGGTLLNTGSAAREDWGEVVYQLAGLEAKRGNGEEAKNLLLIARDAGTLPPIDDVKDDPDFESLRDLDWFKDFTR